MDTPNQNQSNSSTNLIVHLNSLIVLTQKTFLYKVISGLKLWHFPTQCPTRQHLPTWTSSGPPLRNTAWWSLHHTAKGPRQRSSVQWPHDGGMKYITARSLTPNAETIAGDWTLLQLPTHLEKLRNSYSALSDTWVWWNISSYGTFNVFSMAYLFCLIFTSAVMNASND